MIPGCTKAPYDLTPRERQQALARATALAGQLKVGAGWCQLAPGIIGKARCFVVTPCPHGDRWEIEYSFHFYATSEERRAAA